MPFFIVVGSKYKMKFIFGLKDNNNKKKENKFYHSVNNILFSHQLNNKIINMKCHLSYHTINVQGIGQTYKTIRQMFRNNTINTMQSIVSRIQKNFFGTV